MRSKLLLLFLLPGKLALSQQDKDIFRRIGFESERYISVNVLSVAEPQLAFGPAFGHRFSERSEYFTEAAFLTRSPFYKWQGIERLQGLRMIIQYRYHFLQQWKPLINTGTVNRRRREVRQPFIGAEFRVRTTTFSANANFINSSAGDTLTGYSFKASAFTYGGALLFGHSFSVSANDKWKIEVTIGVGAKQKIVNFKNLPPGYKLMADEGSFGLKPPRYYESTGMPLFPGAVRLRYVLD